MTLRDIFSMVRTDKELNKDSREEEETKETMPAYEQEETKVLNIIEGKIIHISERGFGFISSLEIPFTRIFFHWQGLAGDTLRFTELRKGMRVSFLPVQMPDNTYRAIKVRVLE